MGSTVRPSLGRTFVQTEPGDGAVVLCTDAVRCWLGGGGGDSGRVFLIPEATFGVSVSYRSSAFHAAVLTSSLSSSAGAL